MKLLLILISLLISQNILAKSIIGRLMKNYQNNYEHGNHLALLTAQNQLTRINETNLESDIYTLLHRSKDRIISINASHSNFNLKISSLQLFAERGPFRGKLSYHEDLKSFRLTNSDGKSISTHLFIDHFDILKEINLDKEVLIQGAITLINGQSILLIRSIEQAPIDEENEISSITFPRLNQNKTLVGKVIYNTPNESNPNEGLAIVNKNGNFEIKTNDSLILRTLGNKIGEMVSIEGAYHTAWQSDFDDYDYDDYDYGYDDWDDDEYYDDQVVESYVKINSINLSNLHSYAKGKITRTYDNGYKYLVTKSDAEGNIIKSTNVKLVGELADKYHELLNEKEVIVFGKIFQIGEVETLFVESFELALDQ